MSLIRANNLWHRFANGTTALAGINLKIEAGELVVLAGENGSGKSTLLRHLNGLLQPSQGEVFIANKLVRKNVKFARQSVGMIFQDADSQIIGETVSDDIAFGPENLRLPLEEIKARVDFNLYKMGLTSKKNQHPHTLSGGEKRRLAIAAVLAMAPQIILFDEPFSNLDYPGTCQVLHNIVELNQNQQTMIIATHDIEKVIAHASRLVVMKKGKIIMDDDPKNLMKNLENYGIREPCASRFGKNVPSWLI